ncbi:MAG: rod shape-determining protein MreC [Candidatus Omnitrophica bacterium]|nr:rod shape-determining protein MreC [Candidatus Omnitrophota bacterium]
MFRAKKKNLIYALTVVLSLLSLSLLIPLLRKPAVDILKYPLIAFNLARRQIEGLIFYQRNLIQNETLKRELGLLKHKLQAMEEIRLENIRLKNLLSFKQRSVYNLLAARLIARSPDSWSSIIIIDKGSNSGIKPGMVAIGPEGLIGRVTEVTLSTSKIMLINDPNLSVSAILQRSRQEGLVSGALGNTLVMKYLPRQADIKIQDVVVTSGLTGAYPKGLPIGLVSEIVEEFSGLSCYAIIKPFVNLSNIEEVFIIIS